MKDRKKWIYKRYEGKFAYFPIISTWHLVHGLSSSTEPGKKIASRPRKWNIVLMSPGMPRYPPPFVPQVLLPHQNQPADAAAFVSSAFSAALFRLINDDDGDGTFNLFAIYCSNATPLLVATGSCLEKGGYGTRKRNESAGKRIGRKFMEFNEELQKDRVIKYCREESPSTTVKRETTQFRSEADARLVVARRRRGRYSLRRKSCWEIRFRAL